MQSRLYALRNVICPSRPSQWSRHTFKSFATKYVIELITNIQILKKLTFLSTLSLIGGLEWL